ncbi:DUF192 domain-containing protein [Bartonella sp. DGB2]|uniref:DUF192 domain-containing protein n=1 Tax=Bartonella sp. DGB2 TaxID=3388426 RepID=UPI00398F9E61
MMKHLILFSCAWLIWAAIIEQALANNDVALGNKTVERIFLNKGDALKQHTPIVLPIDPTPLKIRGGLGDAIYQIEIARTPAALEAGLMYRYNFPQNRAMLFRFSQNELINMWMANTPLSLDILFADEHGKIVTIKKGAIPFSMEKISSQKPVTYAVELNAGQVEAYGIKVGQYLIHPAI